MLISNRYKVNVVVQCKYATWQVQMKNNPGFIILLVLLEWLLSLVPFRHFAISLFRHFMF